MQLITTQSAHSTAVTATTMAPAAVEIRKRYGDISALTRKYGVAAQRFCATEMKRAIETDMPTLVKMLGAYGSESLARLLEIHIVDALIYMGEERELNSDDVRFIARAICDSERFRLLRFSSVIGFFHLLKVGEFDIYGRINCRKILEAFRRYAVEARERETALCAEIERMRQKELARRAEAEAISWDEYRRRNDIAQTSLSLYIAELITG